MKNVKLYMLCGFVYGIAVALLALVNFGVGLGLSVTAIAVRFKLQPRIKREANTYDGRTLYWVSLLSGVTLVWSSVSWPFSIISVVPLVAAVPLVRDSYRDLRVGNHF